MWAQLITLQSFKVFCRTFGHVFMYFTSNLCLKYSPEQDLLVSIVCPIKSHNFNTVLTNKKNIFPACHLKENFILFQTKCHISTDTAQKMMIYRHIPAPQPELQLVCHQQRQMKRMSGV